MTATVETYTDQQATDEAVLLLARKLHRLYPDAHAALMSKLPDGARLALSLAENRADRVRHEDQLAGIPIGTREYPDPYADLDEEE